MTFTLLEILEGGVLIALIAFFVGAAYGKRIGMKGGTIKGTVAADIAKARKAANDKLQAEIKAIKAKGKEQI